MTIITDEKGDICAIQVGGGSGSWKSGEIEETVNTAIKKGKEIRKLIK